MYHPYAMYEKKMRTCVTKFFIFSSLEIETTVLQIDLNVFKSVKKVIDNRIILSFLAHQPFFHLDRNPSAFGE